jgi:hypothetical protein
MLEKIVPPVGAGGEGQVTQVNQVVVKLASEAPKVQGALVPNAAFDDSVTADGSAPMNSAMPPRNEGERQ